MADDKVVQTNATSKAGGALTEGVQAQPQTQPLTEERIKQLIAEQVEAGRRELQSFKDKARSEIESAQARAQLAEETLTSMETGLQETDPQAAELARLRAKDRFYQQRDAISKQQQTMTSFDKTFQDNINQFITNAGIEPTDKRIDWGEDAKDYLAKQQRILTSVSKIQKENQKTLESGLAQRQKDFEAKIRKDLGLDTEDTTTTASVGVDFQKLSPEEKIKAGLKESKPRRK